jgi:hypothetical protein
MKNAIFWDVALCISCANRRFRGTYRLHLQGRKIREQVAAHCSEVRFVFKFPLRLFEIFLVAMNI